MKLIITAGGQGTKLWPLSREDKPKQFQEIIGSEPLFSYQVKTLLKSYKTSDIYVSTKEKYINFIEQQGPEIPKSNYIIEPNIKKNRGPAEGLAFLKLSMLFPEEPFMIIQGDCIRKPESKFLAMIEQCETLVKRDKKFITGGQKAVFPDTGSDYLDLGDKVKVEGKLEVYKVNRFIDRLNDYHKTKELIENFSISTHANHLCWYPDLILKAYEQYKPNWFDGLMKIKDVIGKANEKSLTEKYYSQMDEGATEEVTKYLMSDGYVVILPFKWSDIGTWGSIYEYFAQNENYTDGDVIALNSEHNILKGRKHKIIAALGIKDIIVVDTEDALLICSRDKEIEIKKLLEKMKDEKLTNFL